MPESQKEERRKSQSKAKKLRSSFSILQRKVAAVIILIGQNRKNYTGPFVQIDGNPLFQKIL
jgi:hypothetical protein